MQGATLSVLRSGDELRFDLQLSEVVAMPSVHHLVTTEQRERMAEHLDAFAQCLAGSHDDEPRFRVLGQILYYQIFPEPIRVQLPSLEGPLTILTNDPSLPWEVLHDDHEFLSLRFPFARKLVLREEMRRFFGLRRTAYTQGEGFSALVIADPTGDLKGARREGEALQQYFSQQGRCDILVGSEANDLNVQRLLISRPYSVIHYCGHIDYARKTSSLRLHSGRLCADEILPLFRGCPLVFLNACYSDFRRETGKAAASTDSLGRTESLAEAFMCGNERGVAPVVVGAMWSIPDEPVEAGPEFSLAFYKNLLAGGAVGESLRSSRLMARDRQWGPRVWGPYVLYGDPLLQPFTRLISDRPPERVPAQSRPREPEPEPEPEEVSPLDTIARQIFHVAMREAKQMKQSGLGTMHLLLGVCDARLPVLERAFEEKGVDRETICQEARSLAEALLKSDDSDFGISPNVFATLQHAMERAEALGRDEVTGEDLLVGLLQCEDGTAVTILEAHGITRDLLLGRLAPVRFGPLGQEDCAPEAWQVLMTAARNARDTGSDVVGTPHLFAGLLQDDQGSLAKSLRRLGLDPATLRRMFGVRKGGEALRDASGIFDVSESVRDILLRARANAEVDHRDKVTPVDFLSAFAFQGGGQTGEWLRRQGVMLEALSSTLFLDDGRLDLARFDESVQKVLAKAVECARGKGHVGVGRIHLLYGLLLVRDGELSRCLHDQQHDAERLADLLYARMAAAPSPNPALELTTAHLRPDLILTLCVAEAEAQRDGKAGISERQLARACVRSGGEAVEVLVQHGVRLSRLFGGGAR